MIVGGQELKRKRAQVSGHARGGGRGRRGRGSRNRREEERGGERREERGGEKREEERGEERGEEREEERARWLSVSRLVVWCMELCSLFARMFGIATRRKSIPIACRAGR